MKYLRVLLLVWGLYGWAAAQTTTSALPEAHPGAMTLDELLQLALRNNPEIRVAIRRVTAAQNRVPGAGALDDPMFTYRDWGTPLRKPWDLNQAQNMFMVQQTFTGRDKRALKTGVAETEVDAARSGLESVRQEVILRVRKAFADLLRNADELQVHMREDELLRNGLQSALANYSVGKSPQQDVLKAQIALAKLSDHRLQLVRERELALAEMNTALGFDPSRPLEVAGTYRVPPELPDFKELQQAALEHRPELAALRAEIERGEKQARLAELGRKPDFTVGAGYMLMPAGTPNRNAYMAEFSMNLPWLNRKRHDAEIGQATAETEAMRAEFDARRAMVFLEIQQALIKARTAQKSLKLYRDVLMPQAETSLKAALAAYENGRADFLNLIDSQEMMLDVQTMSFRLAAELDAGLSELERATGAPLTDAAGNEEKKR